MIKQLFTVLFLVANLPLFSQPSLSYYFNQEVVFNNKVPTPEEVLGYQVGEWHVSHDKLVEYMKAVASASDRVSLEITGYTHEHRPILLLTISSKTNQQQIEKLKNEHINLSNPNNSTPLNLDKMPVVVWLGHSIHGNEASGSNASVLMLYYLAAAQGQEVETMLDNTIVLFDPSFNPDGLNRFASWVNSHKSKILDVNSSSLEHNEAWPGGRSNHYWFDLNRDWLPLQQPESQARVKKFYEWRPNILTDQHEMGTNSTYFFQPGIPSRNNPHTPNTVFEITNKIAQYHAKGMDAIGSQYYSEESFDDYYPGKGSTFPDLNGSIGILFEQASSRGHIQESDNGDVSFPFTIRNHVTTSLSTLKSAQDLRIELLQHQQNFYKSVNKLSTNDVIKAYVFSSNNDINKMQSFISILDQHQITINKLGSNYQRFSSENSYIVKLNQPQYRLIKTIFEKQTTFEDSLFYDVSAWTLPLAFGIDYEEITSKQLATISISNNVKEVKSSSNFTIEKASYGYLLLWEDYMAPSALSFIQQAGLRTKLATHDFKLNNIAYKSGTIFIPIQNQLISPDKIFEIVTKVGATYHVQIDGIQTGNTTGVKLGSPSFEAIDKTNIAVIAGDGVSPYEVGEVWHLLDQRMDIPMSLVSIEELNKNDLNRYTTLIMVKGNYSKLDSLKLKSWLMSGGVVVATKEAGKWLSDKKITSTKYVENKPDSTTQRPYDLLDRYNGAQVIGGAIFETKADLTHPLFYGYNSAKIPVFRNSTLMMERTKSAYANPLMYSSNPLLSGYISKANLTKLSNTAAVQVDAVGRGKVVSFTDDPNFRAFWYGTNRMFLNAIFFGEIMKVN